jgi:G3E family GTPase
LLNHILRDKNHGKKIAVIENEFGVVGVDEGLLVAQEASEDIIIEVKNGCICCTVRGDLVETLKKLKGKMKAGKRIDHIIIETTGLADPAPVCQTFFVEEEISKDFRIDAVVTVVDAKHILQHLHEEKPKDVENESVEQIAFADKILLNKTDLATDEELAKIEKEIKKINKYCKILRTSFKTEAPPMDEILSLDAFDLERVVEMDEEFLNPEQEHVHDQSVGSEGWIIEEPLVLYKLESWIGKLMQEYNTDLFRYKGVIDVLGKDKKFLFQGVHMLFGGDFQGEWDPKEKRKSMFCFIGRNLKRMNLEEGFRACIAKPLRFAVGAKVKARVSSGYMEGTVLKQWDEGNAYRIRLRNGTEVWGPHDDDNFVIAG